MVVRARNRDCSLSKRHGSLTTRAAEAQNSTRPALFLPLKTLNARRVRRRRSRMMVLRSAVEEKKEKWPSVVEESSRESFVLAIQMGKCPQSEVSFGIGLPGPVC